MKSGRVRTLERLLLVLADTCVISLTYLIAYGLRAWLLPRLWELRPVFSLARWWHMFPLFLLPWLLFLAIEGLYNHRLTRTTDWHHVLKAATWTLLMESFLVLLTRTFERVSRLTVLFHWGLTTLLIPPVHQRVQRWILRLPHRRQTVILVAEGNRLPGLMQKVGEVLDPPGLLRGYWCPGGGVDPGSFRTELRAYASLEDLRRDISEHPGVFDLILAPPSTGEGSAALQALMEDTALDVHSVYMVSDMNIFLSMGSVIELWGDVPVIHTRNNLARPFNLLVKRCFDLVFVLSFLPLLAPLSLLLMVLIRLDSRGGPIFTHPRVGRNARPFRCYKFRTMYVDAEARLQRHLEEHPELREEWRRYHKLKRNDPRVTRLGRWLRRFSLDELPQVWNILKGEMSLVGPRPYAVDEVPKIGAAGATIWKTRPGLTGLWQVSGRSERSFEERLQLDLYYVRNWNLWMDVEIILRTVWAVVSGRGAY